jgi:hypothetical protein
LPHAGSLCREPPANLTFDRVERADALQCFGHNRRAVLDVEIVELAPGMRPARCFHDLPLLVERSEAAIGVSLQDAVVAAQMRLRVLALAIGRVAIPHRRRVATAGRTIITDIGP